MDTRINKSAYLSLALDVFCIGTAAIFVKLAAVPGSISAFYSAFFAGMALLPIRLTQKGWLFS